MLLDCNESITSKFFSSLVMISNNGSLVASSSYDQFDNSQYRNFLSKLQNRATELWEAVLCRTPTSNTIELLAEHMMIRESLLEIEMMQKTFANGLETDSTEFV